MCGSNSVIVSQSYIHNSPHNDGHFQVSVTGTVTHPLSMLLNMTTLCYNLAVNIVMYTLLMFAHTHTVTLTHTHTHTHTHTQSFQNPLGLPTGLPTLPPWLPSSLPFNLTSDLPTLPTLPFDTSDLPNLPTSDLPPFPTDPTAPPFPRSKRQANATFLPPSPAPLPGLEGLFLSPDNLRLIACDSQTLGAVLQFQPGVSVVSIMSPLCRHCITIMSSGGGLSFK